MRHLALVCLLVLARSASADVTDDLRDGDRYFEEQEWKKAAAAYDAAIRSAPGQVAPEAYSKRAAIFIIQKDYAGGLQFVRKVAKAAHPDAPEILEQEALLLWVTDDRAGADQLGGDARDENIRTSRGKALAHRCKIAGAVVD